MRGSWHANVSTRFQRDATGARLKSLSCLLKDSCAALQVCHGCDIIPPLGAACELPRAGRRLGLEPAPMERLVAAVRLGASLKKLRSIQAAVSAASTLLASNVAVLPCVGPRRLPNKQTLQRARVRLDVSAMLFNRWHACTRQAGALAVHCVERVSADRCRGLCLRGTNHPRGRWRD